MSPELAALLPVVLVRLLVMAAQAGLLTVLACLHSPQLAAVAVLVSLVMVLLARVFLLARHDKRLQAGKAITVLVALAALVLPMRRRPMRAAMVQNGMPRTALVGAAAEKQQIVPQILMLGQVDNMGPAGVVLHRV